MNKNTWKPRAATWLLALTLISTSAARLRAQAPPELPHTAVGKIAEELIKAVNDSDPQGIEKFVTTRVAAEPWRGISPDRYRTMLRNLKEQSGDLRVVRIFMADETNLRMLMGSERAGKTAGLEIVLPEKDSAAASLLWIHHFPSGGPGPLPAEPMSEREQIAALEKHLTESAEAGIHSGAVLIAKGDRVLIDGAWGYADAVAKKPNRTNMQYGTASVGKMFTAVAIAQLKEAGKLDYDDTIGKFFPDYPNSEAAQKVRIKHLLAHTAGVGDPFKSTHPGAHSHRKTQRDWFETFAEEPLAFQPGERHEYSNGGYVVLAAIVEKLSGMPFAQYLKKHVFEPAGMRQTGLTTASEQVPVSFPHTIDIFQDPLGLKGPQPKAGSHTPEDGAGMGGWTSTTQDLFRFARALRKNQLVNAANTAEITTGKVQFLPPPMNVKYCYGFYEIPMSSGDRMVGHSGGGGDIGYGAEVEILWDSEHTIVVLSNHGLEEARRTAHGIGRFLSGQGQRQTARAN